MKDVDLPPWLVSILALCSGLLLPFSFAPTEWWLAACGSIFILYFLLLSANPRQALWIGWLFGLGYFGIGVQWIYYSLHLFGAAIAPLAALLTLVFVLVMTVFPAACAYLWARLRVPTSPIGNAVLFAALWVLAELLRGKIMNGFPWILVGYSQTSGPFGSLAPVVGVYGLSFLVVLVSCAAVVFAKGPSRITTGAFVVIAAPIFLALIMNVVHFSEPVKEPLTVRMVQANIAQEMKFSQERLTQSLFDYTQMTQQEGISDVDLVVWPETAIPTYFDHVDEVLRPFVQSMDEQGIDVITGGFQRDGSKIYNAVKQLGGEQAVYQKRHLVPFGEYMPLRFLLDFAAKFIIIPMADLAAGEGPHVPITLQGVEVGISICYEDVFGEEMRVLLPTAQMLLNVSNDAWFGNSAAPAQHEQKARMRAREFARPMIRVTNTGISAAIDYRGNVLGRIEHNTTGILDVRVQPRSGYTPYARTGNWPVFILCIIIFLVFVLKRSLTTN
ncbi:apolipoprotein N-acyltransferase [Granulosicoccus sp.]|nr:apolipoprotein N-acyltransferase [Granulosicoccus sp.]MDB4223015.1 apolipoprotein N-acyltransferase [Granulosicoccus sp.]